MTLNQRGQKSESDFKHAEGWSNASSFFFLEQKIDFSDLKHTCETQDQERLIVSTLFTVQ